jgi:protoporphyrinogen oxidase
LTQVSILGSGMAGLGAARRCREVGVEAVVYEKLDRPGGHTRSFVDSSGFIFDDGPHISFTKDERIQELFADAVDGEFEILQAAVNNHWRGHWIKHPAQCNLHGLPAELVAEALRDFVGAQGEEPGEIENYEQWLRASYGDTFAETFPMQYGHKYHTVPASGMSTDWLGPRLYRPELEELLNGALSPSTPDVHYVSHFRYPSHGGFESYLRRFAEEAQVELGREVTRIDPRERRLTFADGSVEGYERLVSSVPLPELLPLVADAPAEALGAAARLACTTCVIVNLGVDRQDISDYHWTYFYDRDFTVTRASFPHLFSPHNVPPGAGSIQAEVYYSKKFRPLDRSPEELVEPVIADFRRCGLLREGDEILFSEARLVPYANVIFDHDRAAALEIVHGYLDEVGIAWCGRYGEWGYHWTDESFVSGERAVEKVLG